MQLLRVLFLYCYHLAGTLVDATSTSYVNQIFKQVFYIVYYKPGFECVPSRESWCL